MFFRAISSSYLIGMSFSPEFFLALSCPRRRASSNHRRLLDPRFRGDDDLVLGAQRAHLRQAGVKNGSGAPSVGLNTTFTFWPTLSVSMSQSTILVCSDGPSFRVT